MSTMSDRHADQSVRSAVAELNRAQRMGSHIAPGRAGIALASSWLLTAVLALSGCAMFGVQLVAAEPSAETGAEQLLPPVQVWQQAELLFEQALGSEAGTNAAQVGFTESALAFEQAARVGYRRGAAWTNAGNAWFEAGSIGRAIAAFRHAQIYRPFDQRVAASLVAARALRGQTPGAEAGHAGPAVVGAGFGAWPLRWCLAGMVLCLAGLCSAWLVALRWPRRSTKVALLMCAALLIASVVVTAVARWAQPRSGVLVGAAVIARKGPDYRYDPAFVQAMQAGIEVTVLEQRAAWYRAALADGRECWLPVHQVSVIAPGSM